MDRSAIKHQYEMEENNAKRRRITITVDGGGKKDTHNKCEQKGRQKINEKINELKDLLPECQNSAANKATVLRSTADSIKRFQFICYQLFASNMKLEEENSKIREEISRLRGAFGLPPTETMPTFDGHNNQRSGGGGNEPIIKPELVDPSSRFNSTNNLPIRNDHFNNSIYVNPVSDAVRSYKLMQTAAMYQQHPQMDPNNYLPEQDEEDSSDGFDDRDSPSPPPNSNYTWK